MTDLPIEQTMVSNLEVIPDLPGLYHQWSISQKILAEACRLISGYPTSKIKAGLENALMRKVLDYTEPNPLDLFAALTVEVLQFGFSCVGMSVADTTVADLYGVIQSTVASDEHTSLPEIEFADDSIVLGAFSLHRNAPVNRLLDFAMQSMSAVDAVSHVLCSALQYNALYAETRHIGPPQCVYDDFHRWGIRNEGFASPFNARLLGKSNAGFFSAFPQTDAVFGSRGSFFHADWKNFDGAWCVDPPFLEETLSQVDTIVGRWRKEGCPPVLFIGPSSYQMKTPFDEEIRLAKGVYFYEGLDGQLHPLPMDVSIWRFGEIEGFDVDRIIAGYLPAEATK